MGSLLHEQVQHSVSAYGCQPQRDGSEKDHEKRIKTRRGNRTRDYLRHSAQIGDAQLRIHFQNSLAKRLAKTGSWHGANHIFGRRVHTPGLRQRDINHGRCGATEQPAFHIPDYADNFPRGWRRFPQVSAHEVADNNVITKGNLLFPPAAGEALVDNGDERRSEERRVGKECRSRWAPDHLKKKKISFRMWVMIVEMH